MDLCQELDLLLAPAQVAIKAFFLKADMLIVTALPKLQKHAATVCVCCVSRTFFSLEMRLSSLVTAATQCSSYNSGV